MLVKRKSKPNMLSIYNKNNLNLTSFCLVRLVSFSNFKITPKFYFLTRVQTIFHINIWINIHLLSALCITRGTFRQIRKVYYCILVLNSGYKFFSKLNLYTVAYIHIYTNSRPWRRFSPLKPRSLNILTKENYTRITFRVNNITPVCC